MEMAACMEDENRKAVVTILHMLLSACGEVSEAKDAEDGLRLSRLIDEMNREFGGWNQLMCPINAEFFAVTNTLLAVLRECMLTHRWVAALRILTSVAHRLPKHIGCTVLGCVLELCAQLSVPLPDSIILRLKTYAWLTEYEVAVECFMSRAVAGHPLAACRTALVPLQHKRDVKGRDESHDRLLIRAYDGLASYAQYLDARLTLEGTSESEKELQDDLSARMKSYARDALEKWDGLFSVPGVWDVFIVKQVELLEQAGDLDTAEEVLLKYAGRSRQAGRISPSAAVWPNALHLLYLFYERHSHPNVKLKQTEILQELCTLVPSHPLALTLYRKWRDDATLASDKDRVGLLFDLLDYATWRDDIRPWRMLARELAQCASELNPNSSASSPTDINSVQSAWSIRKEWWPAYHFAANSLASKCSICSEDTLSLIGFKASVAYFLLSDNNTYTQNALTIADQLIVKTKGMSQLKKVIRKWSSLPLDN